MEKYFEWSSLIEEKKVKLACTKLKGHALIRWDHIQAKCQRKGKEHIRSWEKMKKKLQTKFIPIYYSQILFHRF